MNIATLVLIFSCTIKIVISEPPRYKLRGPLGPPRPPPYPQNLKKWQHQSRPPPIRSRPIPIHMPMQHKIPMGIPPAHNRPIALPVRTFWKNTQATLHTPPEKPYLPQPLPEKAFVPPPSSNAFDYNYHIQSNSIQTHINPIKQLGEKGPIHTIPAPNLSLADKPIVVEEVGKVQHQRQPETATYVQIQKAHQYQVTEMPEHKEYNNQQQYAPVNYGQSSADLHNSYQISNQGLVANQASPIQDLNTNDFQKYLTAYPQQQVLETFAIPVINQQTQYIKQHPDPSTQNHFFPPDQNYVQQIPQEQIASDKISIQPEYHSFNYQEQNKDDLSGQPSETLLGRHAVDSLAQSEYVQNYFDTREDSEVNDVEPDAKPSQQTSEKPEDSAKSSEDSSEYYASLPNKEAADVLASLQAAGKVNSNLMQLTTKAKDKIPMSIYVPDVDDESSKEEINQDNSAYDSKELNDQDYDDYIQEEAASQENASNSDSFGERIKPKRI